MHLAVTFLGSAFCIQVSLSVHPLFFAVPRFCLCDDTGPDLQGQVWWSHVGANWHLGFVAWIRPQPKGQTAQAQCSKDQGQDTDSVLCGQGRNGSLLTPHLKRLKELIDWP